MVNIKKENAKLNSFKSQFFSKVLPLVILGVCFGIALLAKAGYIDLKQVGEKAESVFAPAKESSYLIETPKLPELTDGIVGEPYEVKITARWEEGPIGVFKFSLFDPEYQPLPLGLSLSSDGTISGVPTKKGTYNFGVCLEDQEGEEKCYDGQIIINPKPEPEPGPYKGPCPTEQTPPCWERSETSEGIIVETEATITYDYCQCPEGTYDSGHLDTVSPGGPYKICICKEH